MTDTYAIPPPNTPLVDSRGFVTRVWWRFLSSLFVTTGGGSGVTISLSGLQILTAQIYSLHATVDTLQRQVKELQTQLSAYAPR